jgi:putative oxidoreductase
MHALQAIITILGRIMLAAIFLMSALGNKIPQFNGVVEKMTAEGVPAANVMLSGAIVFLIVGAVSIIIGYKARIGAALLFAFLALATYFFHDFWTFAPDSKEFQMQMIQFMKNLALMGAMLILFANGAGAGSLDRRATFSKSAIAE